MVQQCAEWQENGEHTRRSMELNEAIIWQNQNIEASEKVIEIWAVVLLETSEKQAKYIIPYLCI